MQPDFVYNFNDIKETLDSSISFSDIYHSSIDPEHVGQCMRRMYYRITRTKMPINHELFEFYKEAHCQSVIDKWAYFFSKCKYISVIGNRMVFGLPEWHLKGSADFIINFGGKNRLVKIKPVNNDEYNKVVEQGVKKKHVIELIVYLWMAEVDSGVIIYENNDNQNYVAFEVTMSNTIVNSVKMKCSDLVNYRVKGVLPKRISNAGKDAKECNMCEYFGECFNKGEKDE